MKVITLNSAESKNSVKLKDLHPFVVFSAEPFLAHNTDLFLCLYNKNGKKCVVGLNGQDSERSLADLMEKEIAWCCSDLVFNNVKYHIYAQIEL